MIAKGVRFNADKNQVGNYYYTKVWWSPQLIVESSSLLMFFWSLTDFTFLPWYYCVLCWIWSFSMKSACCRHEIFNSNRSTKLMRKDLVLAPLLAYAETLRQRAQQRNNSLVQSRIKVFSLAYTIFCQSSFSCISVLYEMMGRIVSDA